MDNVCTECNEDDGFHTLDCSKSKLTLEQQKALMKFVAEFALKDIKEKTYN